MNTPTPPATHEMREAFEKYCQVRGYPVHVVVGLEEAAKVMVADNAFEAGFNAGQASRATAHPTVAGDAMLHRDAVTKITKAVAKLVTGEGFSSPYQEDHKRKAPKWVWRLFESDRRARGYIAQDISQALGWLRTPHHPDASER